MSSTSSATSLPKRSDDNTVRVLFEISNAVNQTDDLDELYKSIHTSLGKVLNARNFFIALYHEEKDSMTFPYYVDETDANPGEVFEISGKRSLAAKVVKQASPLMATQEELAQMYTHSPDKLIGSPSKIWIGAPLKIKDNAFGALVLQCYRSPDTYTRKDLALLKSISEFVALSIERKRAETAQNESEALTRTLYEISRAINTNETLSQIFENLHASLQQVMDVTNFYIGLYEKETNKISFPFYRDEYDDLSVWDNIYLKKNSLTYEVFAEMKPVLFTKEQIEMRARQNKVVGSIPMIWLGLPLLIKGEAKGVMVTQSYSDPNLFDQRDIDFLISVSEQVAMAIEQKAAEESIRQNEIITSTLFSISNAVNTSRNLPDLYRSIHTSLDKIVDMTNFLIGLYHAATDRIYFAYYVDQFDNLQDQSVPLSEGSIGKDVIQSGKPLFLNETEMMKRITKNKAVGTAAKTWMGVPLKVDDTVIGYMAAQSYTDPDMFSPRDMEIFSSVSEQVALAIDRKRSVEELKQTEKLTRTLFQISNAVNTTLNLDELYRSLHRSLAGVVDVTNFAIGIYDQNRDLISYPYYVDETGDTYTQIENVSSSGILAAEVINRGRPFIINKEGIEKRAREKGYHQYGGASAQWLGVPLKTQDDVIGVIVVQNYENPNHFQQKDADILSAVSDQVAVAIDRKLSEEKIIQNELLTQTLFKISNAVNTAGNLNDLYQKIYDALNQLIPLPNCFFAIVDKKKKRLSFPFFIDEHDSLEMITKGLEKYEESTSNTSRIISTKEPLFLTEDLLNENLKNEKTIGTNSKVWLGVPLIVRDEVIGVMVVQHYEDPDYFTHKDMELLTAVTDQVAIAIDRKREEEARLKSEQLNKILFDISNAVNTTDRLSALFNSIYDSLNKLIALPNFFICIYQKETNSMYFPLYIDEYDSEETITFTIENIDEDSSITTDVINSKKPLFLTKEDLVIKKTENKIVGKVPLIWLGIPLIVRDEVIGVMAAQHYHDPAYFTQKDMELFISVSDQVALAIERKQSQQIIFDREKQIIELSRQTEELSLVAASIISMKDEKKIFKHISKAIVENSDYQRLVISYFIDKPPYREIIGSEGIPKEDIQKIQSVIVPKKHFEAIFSEGQSIGHFTCYLPHTVKGILSTDLLAVFSKGVKRGFGHLWHPDDLLFIPMQDTDGNTMGVISVGHSKSGKLPTNETVRPLEIFSSLISQIIIVRRIQSELKDHKENLEKIVAGRTKELTAEISERIQIEKRLKKAKIDAEAAAQAKLEFLANMSHEIRTPINGVMGMAEIALERNLDEELQQIFRTIDSEADQLLKIINGILDFSKIEAGKLAIEQIPFDLHAMFEKTCSTLAMGMPDDKIEFIFYISPDVPAHLIGDPGRLRQVLVNLGGNAIKFTHQGEIFIKVEMIKQTAAAVDLRFIVKDTGIGIAKENHRHIFDSFSQADGSTTRQYGGTGLGTTISKQIIELMGGNIGFESALGKGSVFWFTISLAKQPDKKEASLPLSDIDLNGLNILVVEDNQTNRFVFESYLDSFGCIPTTADNAQQGLEKIRTGLENGTRFDAVITDQALPDSNGFELAEKIRSQPEEPSLPLILLTSAGHIGDGQKCRDIGINAYLPKPVKKMELKTVIATVLGKIHIPDHIDEGPVTRHSMAESHAVKMNILLVEDYPTNQKVAQKHLSNAGFRSILAQNGKQAVDLFKKELFDLVLMDIQMPEMDGYQATRLIREYENRLEKTIAGSGGSTAEKIPRVPIIAMTAHAIKGYKERCLAAGMDDYITKPLKKESFLGMIEKWLAIRHQKDIAPLTSLTTEENPVLENKNENEKPFDYEKALDEFEDDREFLEEVLSEFCDNLTGQFEQIENAITGNNADQVQKQAHAIKGGSANLTAMPMSKAAHTLELIGKSGDLKTAPDAFEALKTEFEILKTFLSTVDL